MILTASCQNLVTLLNAQERQKQMNLNVFDLDKMHF